ncbi:MAG: hypothetical protein ABR875_00715 [Minisyncoccia bacterium]
MDPNNGTLALAACPINSGGLDGTVSLSQRKFPLSHQPAQILTSSMDGIVS